MRRYVSVLLVFSLICTFFTVPTFAVENSAAPIQDVIVDYDLVTALDTYLVDEKFVDFIGKLPFVDFESAFWGIMDKMVLISGYGRFNSYEALASACSAVNAYFNNPNPSIWDLDELIDKAVVANVLNNLFVKTQWEVVPHSEYGYVIAEANTGAVLCHSSGVFPYYKPVTTDPDTGEEVEDPALGGKWVRIDKVAAVKNVVSEATLDDIAYELIVSGEKLKYSSVQDKWRGIQSTTRYENGIPYVYCDTQSRQYVNQLDPDEFAVNNDQNVYIQDDDGDGVYDDGETTENQFIDLDSNTVWFPDGTFNYIDNLIYDESTKTYYVDAHQEYDIDNNTYITNNYYYEYHIDYTSITYIGQTEEYDKKYEYYYELPDGRSSADLTADELLALNTQIDVLPYIRSADDTSIRALYHFDGDTLDSSYWSHLGGFTWNEGASITYMDAGAFNGALYLDETDHQFDVALPSNLASKDFTIQFRLYQSYTAAPQTDSSLKIGDVTLLQFDGQSIKNASGKTLSPVSVGNWQEICLMRTGGVIYTFHNGVCIGSVSNNTTLGGTLSFTFGSSQQTYKYFDELRVVEKALYDTSGYTPTSVPFDTNLALVLPDSQLPVADEYWSFNDEGNLLSYSDFTTAGLSSDWISVDSLNAYDYSQWIEYLAGYDNEGLWMSYGDRTVSMYSGFTSVGPSDAYGDEALVFPLYEVQTLESFLEDFDTTVGTEYTFSIMLTDDEVYSTTFAVTNNLWDSLDPWETVLPNGCSIGCKVDCGGAFLFISIPDDTTLEFRYLELVQGDTANTGHEFLSSVVAMDKDDLNTPSLAVRTDLEITGYQLGGVRPSLPEKGLVWALVEGSRITSLQVYNGQAWEEVDGRIWTGSRWVPYYAFDVLLLKDMYDIVEADPSLNPIYTEAGFWKWLQSAWGDMISRLDAILEALGGSPNAPDSSEDFKGEEDNPETEEDEGWVLIDLLVVLKDGAWTIVKGVVTTGVNGVAGLAQGVSDLGGYFNAFDRDTPGGVLDILNQGGETVWD